MAQVLSKLLIPRSPARETGRGLASFITYAALRCAWDIPSFHAIIPLSRSNACTIAAVLAATAAFGLGCQGPGECPVALREARRSLVRAQRAVVVTAVADLLKQPDEHAALSDQALFGDGVEIVSAEARACVTPRDLFIEVSTAAHYRGFVDTRALRPLAQAEPDYRRGGPLLRVATRLASVYEQPTVTAHKPILLLPVDSELRFFKNLDERWQEVLLPNGRHGFIQAGDVTLAPPVSVPSPACVIEHARLYVGTPYLWGGRSTLGIDCSGLVSNAFMACGVVPPRDAGPQYLWSQVKALPMESERLEPEKLEPADLVFFGEPRQGGPKVTHVGIYVGQGRFIHATTHERPIVQESPLSDPYFQRNFVGARRFAFSPPATVP